MRLSKILCVALALCLLSVEGMAQNQSFTNFITNSPAATVPLGNTGLVPVIQDGVTKHFVLPSGTTSMLTDASNALLPDARYNINYTPAVCTGVGSDSGLTITNGSNAISINGGSLSATNVGQPIAIQRVGSTQSYGTGTVNAPGTGYVAAQTITITGGAKVDILTTTAVAASIVSGGSGGVDGTWKIRGTTLGARPRRDRVALIATIVGGTVTAVSLTAPGAKGGAYDNPSFTGANEPFVSEDPLNPNLTGVVIDLTLGVDNVRRRAADAGSYTTVPANPVAQIATSGSGTGATLDVIWKGDTLVSTITSVESATTAHIAAAAQSSGSGVGYLYGPDHGATIQAAVNAEIPVRLPHTAQSSNKTTGICTHTSPLLFHNGTILIGEGTSSDVTPPTILAYIGARNDSAVQLSGDSDVDNNRIAGAQIGNFELDGELLIGIGYKQAGVQGSQIFPISTRRNTSLGMQFTASSLYDNWRNNYYGLWVRDDSGGYNQNGIRIGPGYQVGSTGKFRDTDVGTFYDISINLDETATGYGLKCEVADSNTFIKVRIRTAYDVPGIELKDGDLGDFCRANDFLTVDPGKGSVTADGIKLNPSSNRMLFYNLLNGATDPDFNDEDGPTITGGAYLGTTMNTGSTAGLIIRGQSYANRMQPRRQNGLISRVSDANASVPGNPITGGSCGSDCKNVLAWADENNVVRVLGSAVGSATPNTPSSCGTSPSVTGLDKAGTILIGGGGAVTSCTLAFGETWPNAPQCTVTGVGTGSAVVSLDPLPTTTTMVIVSSADMQSKRVIYNCTPRL